MNKMMKIERIKKGITQKDVAVAVGVTQKYISLIESKNIKPSPKIMEKISDCLGVSVQILFFNNNNNRKE